MSVTGFVIYNGGGKNVAEDSIRTEKRHLTRTPGFWAVPWGSRDTKLSGSG